MDQDPEQLVLSMVNDALEQEQPPTNATTQADSSETPPEKKKIDFNLIDPEKWETGVVQDWKNTWGFIQKERTDRDHQIFVHAANVNCIDRHTFLRKGMQVKFQEATRADDPTRKCAVNVCAIDGKPLSYFEQQGETDNFQRRSVGDLGTKYTGTVKNYFYRRKFGWIKPDDGGVERKFLARDVYVAREDILSKDFPPGLRPGERVQFELYEDDRGLGACRVTAEDGEFIDAQPVRKEFEGIVFKGSVEKFRLNGYLFIRPEDDLKEYGVWGHDIHAHVESINTEQRPARVMDQQKVTFKLMKDKNGFHAFDINDENGEAIFVPEEYTDPQEVEEEGPMRELFEGVFDGVVRTFGWSKGSGWIEAKNLSPELANKATHRDGWIYFYRKDLVSQDKVFGVHTGVNVKFSCYVDEKGIGAREITDENGDAIKDQVRPVDSPNDQVQHGIVNYYDRQKRVCHIKYKGKIHAVPKKHILILREAEHLLHRGTRVEFLVERWRGRSFLKQVSFPGRRAKPKPDEMPDHQQDPKGGQQGYNSGPPNGYTQHQQQTLFNPYAQSPYPMQFPQSAAPFFEFFNDQRQTPNPPPPSAGGFTQYPGQLPQQQYGHQQYGGRY